MNQYTEKVKRKYPVGAEVSTLGGVYFRVWAPGRNKVDIVFYNKENNLPESALQSEGNGYFSGFVKEAGAGSLYKFRLDDGDAFADPATRFQPEGPHGPSQVIDTEKFIWNDENWKGINIKGQIIYEIHAGTFTPEGTWIAAAVQLKELARLGITTIEVMPIADFPGKFGWGYDGVNLFAPARIYGTPDELKTFVNEAHLNGIAVILDVVYNHFGPDGNYLANFSPHYFSKEYYTEWGDAINFDGKLSEPVREFFTTNASYWIMEYHLDGLRLDATQSIFDKSQSNNIIAAITSSAKAAAKTRDIIVIAENEPQNALLLRKSTEGGFEIDALWNDDFHHSAMVALTKRKEAYYTDYFGHAQEFVSGCKYGFLYQGQLYKWQKNRRGSSTRGLKPWNFVNFIQNHDQIANSCRGLYCHKLSSMASYKTMSAFLLLSPQTPMIFQGQEFAASNPFFYFADHKPELAELIAKGRIEFLSQFRSLALPETQAMLPVPSDVKTFISSKLNFDDRIKHKEIYQMYKDIISIRKEDKIIKHQAEYGIDGAVLSDNAFIIRYFSPDEDDRLLLVNFGVDLHFNPAPEPLLAPAKNMSWEVIFSTEDLKYGGIGTAPPDSEENWQIPGRTCILLAPSDVKEI